ncbi:hypothetical protein WS64_23230 [Burkholderia anthina]|uniref:Uncharacterized protein n=1 Tax=Burkholderia anthina TaxID=179879 RepID=A0AAW3PRJ9_9BURK|nr:hypothetical protein WS64_23230 [Burkholderia anthina]
MLQPRLVTQFDVESRSPWQRAELRQQAVYQALEQPCTNRTMANIFRDFVTRIETNIGKVEPACIDFSIRHCIAWSRFRSFDSRQYLLE